MRFELCATWYVLAAVALGAGCEQPAYTVCGTLVCPAGYQCLDGKCAGEDQISACVEQEEEAACEASSLDGVCRGGFCQIDLCGNGLLDTYPVRGPEPCDGDLGRLACADVGADFGLTTCTAACTSDTTACESFGWKPASLGRGIGRLVVARNGEVLLARGSLLSTLAPNKTWLNAARITNTIADVVPVGATRALLVSTRGATKFLDLWDLEKPDGTAVKQNLSVATDANISWYGGVATDETTVLASLATTAKLYRLNGATWSAPTYALAWGTCPERQNTFEKALRLHWAANSTKVFGSIGTSLVTLSIDHGNSSISCEVSANVTVPLIALGGVADTPTWMVDRDGKVYDGDRNLRNLDSLDSLALEFAVADGSRIWAVSNSDIYMFEAGSWWKSGRGVAIPRENFEGRVNAYHPLVVHQGRLLAAAQAQEAGLVARGPREWMTGWRSAATGEITALAVDERGVPWAATLLRGPSPSAWLRIGSRARPITGITTAVSDLRFIDGAVYAASSQGLFTLTVNESNVTPVLVDGLSGAVRGLWHHADTLYVATTVGQAAPKFYARPKGQTAWTMLFDSSSKKCSSTNALFTGAVVAGLPSLFLHCKTDETEARSLLIVLPYPWREASSVDVANGNYNRVVSDRTGVAWLVAPQGRVLRLAPPFSKPEPIPVMRRSPFDGTLSQSVESMNDVMVTPDNEIYLVGDNLSVYRWDGTRFVRVSPSQLEPVHYVASRWHAGQMYLAHRTGVDVLYSLPN